MKIRREDLPARFRQRFRPDDDIEAIADDERRLEQKLVEAIKGQSDGAWRSFLDERDGLRWFVCPTGVFYEGPDHLKGLRVELTDLTGNVPVEWSPYSPSVFAIKADRPTAIPAMLFSAEVPGFSWTFDADGRVGMKE